MLRRGRRVVEAELTRDVAEQTARLLVRGFRSGQLLFGRIGEGSWHARLLLRRLSVLDLQLVHALGDALRIRLLAFGCLGIGFSNLPLLFISLLPLSLSDARFFCFLAEDTINVVTLRLQPAQIAFHQDLKCEEVLLARTFEQQRHDRATNFVEVESCRDEKRSLSLRFSVQSTLR